MVIRLFWLVARVFLLVAGVFCVIAMVFLVVTRFLFCFCSLDSIMDCKEHEGEDI